MVELFAHNPQSVMNSSVPLIYPECMLFTDQFYSSNEDGSIIGAPPSALHDDDKVLQHNRFASLQDHFRSRISNPGILSSSNPLYHFFAFNNLTNLGMRGCDSRIIPRRGFAEFQGKGGVKLKD